MSILSELFRPRRYASRAAYIPAGLVSFWFGLWGMEDAGLIGARPYAALLSICILQMKYRTLIGWSVVILPCSAYAVAVAVSLGNAHGEWGEYVIFVLAGMIPTIVLLIGHPFRKPREKW